MSPLPARDVPALLSQLAREPQRPALSFYRGKSLVGRLTYGELAERVETLAGGLHGEFGVRPGDRVAISN